MGRFSCHFFDSLLLGLWLLIIPIVFVALVFMTIPSLPILIGQKFTPELQFGLTVIGFFFWSACRININYQISLWVIPFIYVFWQVLIGSLWTTGVMPKPVNIFIAPVIPCLVTSIFAPVLSFIWVRIKPHRRLSRGEKIKKKQKRDANYSE